LAVEEPAFDGMSKGGVNAYQWATSNRTRYPPSMRQSRHPAGRFPKLVGTRQARRALLNVCGSLDFVLEKNTKVIENV